MGERCYSVQKMQLGLKLQHLYLLLPGYFISHSLKWFYLNSTNNMVPTNANLHKTNLVITSTERTVVLTRSQNADLFMQLSQQFDV